MTVRDISHMLSATVRLRLVMADFENVTDSPLDYDFI